MTTKRIILLSPFEPQNIDNWSGTLFYIYQALRDNDAGIEIRCVNRGLVDSVLVIVDKLLWKLGIRFDIRSSTLFAVLRGMELSIRIFFIRATAIVAVIASNDIAYLKTKKTIIHVSDATFDAYARMVLKNAILAAAQANKFPPWIRLQADRNELRALNKARYCIFSSKWAADSARLHYGIPADRVFDLPFGPNIPRHRIEETYRKKTVSPWSEVRILFVSANWTRKNGDKAVEICRQLIRLGTNARLITIGHTADYAKRLEFVQDLGFLQKSEPKELAQLCQAY